MVETWRETALEALERRARYAAAHPIVGLLSARQLAEIRASHEEEYVYFDGIPPVLARIECRADRQVWPCAAVVLLEHIDALG